MLLLRNAIFQVQKSPCGHVSAQKYNFAGAKKAPAGMLLLRNSFVWYKKAPAGMLLLRNAIFRYKKAPAGMSLLRNAIF